MSGSCPLHDALPSDTPLQIHYGEMTTAAALATLCYDNAHAFAASGLLVETRLKPIFSAQTRLVELFTAQGAVMHGMHDHVRYAADEHRLMAQIELDETAHGGIDATARLAYEAVRAFNAHSGYPHVLRMWNYMDDINAGTGDAERYKQFCVGRAQGYGAMPAETYPAASALGRQRRTGQLQVFWLAARQPGRRLENPRQVSAYRYPRDYGPSAPTFARACLLASGALLISGTSSIVGHASRHPDDVGAQLHETLDNIETLIAHAQQWAPALAPQPDRSSLLKVYLRHGEDAARVERELRRRYTASPATLLLAADICRRELLVEIDCAHGLAVS